MQNFAHPPQYGKKIPAEQQESEDIAYKSSQDDPGGAATCVHRHVSLKLHSIYRQLRKSILYRNCMNIQAIPFRTEFRKRLAIYLL